MLDPRGLIKKVNLTFTTKFFWMFVCHLLSPAAGDKILTWDRAVLVATLVAGFEIDFTKLLILMIHERAFKTSTTYQFTCIIFHLCTDAGVVI